MRTLWMILARWHERAAEAQVKREAQAAALCIRHARQAEKFFRKAAQ